MKKEPKGYPWLPFSKRSFTNSITEFSYRSW